jgi:hypothetical protein
MRGLIKCLLDIGQETEAAVLIGAHQAQEGNMDAAFGAWETALAESQNPLAAIYLGNTLVEQQCFVQAVMLLPGHVSPFEDLHQ